MRGIQDIRTTPKGGSIHSLPPQEDSAYLDAYLLRKEEERLKTLLNVLTKRQRQIDGRLEEIRVAMRNLLGNTPREEAVSGASDQTAEGKRSQPDGWATMPFRVLGR